MTTYRKKLIEVALPLDAINKASAREKSIRHGHPSTLHLWWARRPLAACRAVLFGQLVDDPSAWPDLFPTEEDQDRERKRIFAVIEDLVVWENSNNEAVIDAARLEIARSIARGRKADGQGDERDDAVLVKMPKAEAVNAYLAEVAPPVHDPFAGGGSIPLEAQRLGLRAYASDLNPVAVLINKAMIEIPPKFAGMPPVNPEARKDKQLFEKKWKGAQGLAEDVRYYGRRMRDEAEKRIGHLYPKIEITKDMVAGVGFMPARPDLEPLVGQELTVIAWLWARTVRSPNPAFASVEVPLASTFMLSTKAGKEAYVEPVIHPSPPGRGAGGEGYAFTVKVGKPANAEAAKRGTKLSRGANFKCLMSGTPMEGDYIKDEGKAGRMGARLMAIVAEGVRGRVYLSPTPEHEAAARKAKPEWKPEGDIPRRMTGGNCTPYGLTTWGDLFTPRQLVALTTFSDLVGEAIEHVQRDALAAGLPDDRKALRDGGRGATAYSEAVGVYLSFSGSRMADRHSSLCRWDPNPSGYAPKIAHTFGRQALPMVWDYVEGNPFSPSSGNLLDAFGWVAKVIDTSLSAQTAGVASQLDAQQQVATSGKVVSADPPYYDNIGYADLSDFFYIWLRRSLKPVFPRLLSTLAVPKAEELVATPYRHGSKEKAEAFFLGGMTQAMHRLAEQAHPAFPVSVYYAFKQSERGDADGITNTGWDTFLAAIMEAGFSIGGTWPMRTELGNRMIGSGTNALASSIVLVCRKRDPEATAITRADFRRTLRDELPVAMKTLQASNIAPVDVAQAAIGPGMAIFSGHSKVIEADGSAMTVRTALQLINEALDEYLNAQEGEAGPDTRFAITWFEQYQYTPGPFGEAETLAKARNVSVSGVVEAGIIESRAGKVRLLRRDELPGDWDPTRDKRLTAWEGVQHLIKRMDEQGERAAAELLVALGGEMAERARDLAYRLYTTCERKGWAEEARAYNGLVVAWPELTRLVGKKETGSTQGELF